MRHRIELCTLLLLLSSCLGSGSRPEVLTSPTSFPGFPNPAHFGAVWAEASFVTNHAQVFETDLTKEDLLPLFVRVGRRGEEAGAPRLVDEVLDPHLYLQDGTVLEWVPQDQLQLARRRTTDLVAETALKLSLLEPWEASPGGFLFFRIPEDVRLSGSYALSSNDHLHRELPLAHSLLAFDVFTDDGPRRLFVGLGEERRPVH